MTKSWACVTRREPARGVLGTGGRGQGGQNHGCRPAGAQERLGHGAHGLASHLSSQVTPATETLPGDPRFKDVQGQARQAQPSKTAPLPPPQKCPGPTNPVWQPGGRSEGPEPGCGLYSRSWGACPRSPENSHSCFREQARWQPSPVPMSTQFLRLVGGSWPRGFPERKTPGQPGPRAALEGPENADVGGATLASVRGVTKATRPWAGGTGR